RDGPQTVGEHPDVDVAPPELCHIGGHAVSWSFAHACPRIPLGRSSCIGPCTTDVEEETTQTPMTRSGPWRPGVPGQPGSARAGRRRHVSTQPGEQNSTMEPRTSWAISSAVSWVNGSPQMGSWVPSALLGAMRMLEAGTGFSTPRSVTWVSDTVSPQLGTGPITERP